MKKERWKRIEGYENYEVSDAGRVRSIDRTVSDSRRSWFVRGVLLKPWLANGYKKVTIFNTKGKKKQYVHILVAKAFVRNPKHLPEVNHVDEERANCRASNLEWRTHGGNMWHSAHKKGDGIAFCKTRSKQRKPWVLMHRGKYYGRFETFAEAQTEKKRRNWRHI